MAQAQEAGIREAADGVGRRTAENGVFDECCECWLPQRGGPAATREVRVTNRAGLHLRAAAALASRASASPASVRIRAAGRLACGRSVLAILSLGLARGDSFTIEARGERAAEAVEVIAELAAAGFGED